MRKRTISILAGLLLLAEIGVRAADKPNPTPPASKPNPASSADKPGQADKPDAIRLDYAKATAALAKLNLQIARDRNKTVPGTLPAAQIMELEAQVVLTDKYVAAAQQPGPMDAKQLTIDSAEIALKLAQADYDRALEVNRLKALSPMTIERLKLKVDIARLNVTRAKQLDPDSTTARLAYELDRLREEVLEVSVGRMGIVDLN